MSIVCIRTIGNYFRQPHLHDSTQLKKVAKKSGPTY